LLLQVAHPLCRLMLLAINLRVYIYTFVDRLSCREINFRERRDGEVSQKRWGGWCVAAAAAAAMVGSSCIGWCSRVLGLLQSMLKLRKQQELIQSKVCTTRS
jgi:hypothetical protein